MPNSPKVITSPNTPVIPPKVFIGTKQWIYEICEKVAKTHAEARSLAFLITLWLEYLSLHAFHFSVPFCPKYIQLFSLLLLDVALERAGDLRKRCPTENLFKLAFTGFSPQEVYKLQGEIEALDLFNTVKIEPLLKSLEVLLHKIPQTPQIRNVSLILLDAYNLQFFSIVADKPKVAAACVAVARFWVLEKEEQRWPDDYLAKTSLSFADFKDAYEQVYCVAYMINQKNLAKKKEEQKNRTRQARNNTQDTNNSVKKLVSEGLPRTHVYSDA
jgi:hypothetical protein